MLTPAPLPTWLSLCRALLRRSLPDRELALPWHHEGEAAGWLSRSAWSLALIALWRKSRAPESSVTVWIPDFFCNASLLPLRKAGVRLVFYPVTNDLSPDIVACRTLADTEPLDIFLLAHYFGCPVPVAPARDFCSHHGAWLIEDATHVLRPVDGIGNYGDFVVYSPHKHLPLPDGAVLVIRPNGPAKFGKDGLALFGEAGNWHEKLSELHKNLGYSARSWQAHAPIWLIKRVLQKFGVRSLSRSASSFTESLESNQASPRLTAPSMSAIARRVLTVVLLDFGKVERLRQRHQMLWDALLLDDRVTQQANVLAAERATNREWIPYLASFWVPLANAGETHDQWQRRGLPVTTWPDLPPEVVANKERHANAWNLRCSRLYLPVHQSLTASGLVDQCMLPPAAQESVKSIRLVWNEVTPEQWEQWMEKAGRSNLLQSWAYADAKAAQGGWRVKRGVFYQGDDPIAFVQVLQNGLPGFLTVSRINRGPVLLKSLSQYELSAIWRELAYLGCIWRGRVLSVAPELRLTGSSLVLMENMGFRQFSPLAYESIWVDLDIDLGVLRKRLDGKWRNMLTFAEKSGLELEIGVNEAAFEWMITQYQDLMRANNFSGPPVGLLLNLRRQISSEDLMPILRAGHEGELVAGISIARHGGGATYLLGWNGAKGRELKANQYLLWQAMLYLKQSGLKWLDLGGISEEQTPGISAFKLGVNGERYELIGEYWKW